MRTRPRCCLDELDRPRHRVAGVLIGLGLVLGVAVMAGGGVARAQGAGEAGAGEAGDGAAEHPTSSLTYERQRGAEQCPDEAELRDAVSARLGYVPFRDEAPQHVRTVIRGERGGLLATVDVFDGTGELVGQREIRSRTRDCEELARGVALAISVAIDPVSLLGPGPGAESGAETETESESGAETEAGAESGAEAETEAEAEAETESETETETETETESETEAETEAESETESETESESGAGAGAGAGDRAAGRQVVVALDVLVGWEVVPRVRPGFGVRVNVDREWLGSELAVRGWLPAAASAEDGGRVSAYQLDVRALGCGVGAGFRGCAGGFAGVMPARGSGVANARRGLGVVAGIAVLAGYDLGVGERVSLGVRVGVDVPVLRPSLRLSNAEVWQGAPVSVLAAIGVGVRLR